jgi:glycosyltransferase involved in cell wall biosynthesis
MLVSIIIPVFNTAKYLNKCIISVLNQSYKNIEIIIVNDGSTDSSDSIIRIFLENSTSIKYVLKENGGLSSARNAGLLISSGDYVMFLDSDDWLGENHIANFMNHIKTINYFPDLVLSSYTLVDSKINKNYYPERFLSNQKINRIHFNNITLCKSLLSGSNSFGFFHQSFSLMPVWKNLYKRQLILSNKLYFYNEREIFLEDYDFNLRFLLIISSYSICKNYDYFHMTVTNSLSKSFKSNLSKMFILLFSRTKAIMDNFPELQPKLLSNFIVIKSVNLAYNYSLSNFFLFKKVVIDYLNSIKPYNAFSSNNNFNFPSSGYKFLYKLLKLRKFYLLYFFLNIFRFFNSLYRFYLYIKSTKNYAN